MNFVGKIIVLGAGGYMGKIYLACLKALGFDMTKIIAVDIDAGRLAVIKETYPTMLCTIDHDLALSKNPDIAFVFVNSTAHLKEIKRCYDYGIRKFYVEKPLVYTLEEMNELKSFFKDAELYNAYVINFSGILNDLMEFIEKEDLIVLQASSVWGKNWVSVPRPMGGDAEEEMPHPLCLIYSIINNTQGPLELSQVDAYMSNIQHVQDEYLEMAKNQEYQFPDVMNDTTSSYFEFENEADPVPVFIYSSFNKTLQERWVEMSLIRRTDWLDGKKLPTHKIRMDFDMMPQATLDLLDLFLEARTPDDSETYLRIKNLVREAGTRDVLRIFDAKTDYLIKKTIFKGNKIKDMVNAGIQALNGEEKDLRLIDFEGAGEQMKLLHFAIQD